MTNVDKESYRQDTISVDLRTHWEIGIPLKQSTALGYNYSQGMQTRFFSENGV